MSFCLEGVFTITELVGSYAGEQASQARISKAFIMEIKRNQCSPLTPNISLLALVLALAAGAAVEASADNIVWTNSAGGNWATANNWSPHQVPGATDFAYITNSSTYTVTNSANTTVAGLTLGGDSGTQTLVTSGTFTLNGDGQGNANATLNISGGTWGGSGMLTLAGPLNWTGGLITGGVQCNGGAISGAADKRLVGGRLVNAGLLTFSGPIFYAYSGASISNLATATFDITGDVGIIFAGSGYGTIYNAGLFRKSGGTGTAGVAMTFNNTGTVLAQTGTLSLQNGGTNSGIYSATGAGTLSFGGGTHTLDAGSLVTGDGTVGCSGGTANVNGTVATSGTLLVNGGVLNVNTVGSAGAVAVSGGTLGGSGAITTGGALNWTGGWISGGVQCNGGAISGAADKRLVGGRLVNAGLLAFSGPVFYAYGGASISNLATGTFDITGDVGVIFAASGCGTVYNAGLFRKSGGTGVSSIVMTFNNTGTLEADSGVLSLPYAGNYSGAVSANGTGILDFPSGTHNLNANCQLAGNGLIRFSGATVNVNAPVPGDASVTVQLNGSTLAGGGTLALTGPLNWISGSITGGVQCNGGAISGTGDKRVVGGRLVNAGLLTFSTTVFYAYGGASISNLATGTFDITGDVGITFVSSGIGTLDNAGLLRKSGGAGVSAVVMTFNNTGTVLAQTGTLSLQYGGTNSGVCSATGPGTLSFGGGTHTLDAASSLTGDGTISCSAGTANLNGAVDVSGTLLVNGGVVNANTIGNVGAVTVSSGTLGGSGMVTATGALNWTEGTISGGVQCNGGAISGSGYKYLNGGRLINAGWLTYSGGNFYAYNASVVSNLVAATLSITGDGGFFYSSGACGTIYNAGLFRKSGGTGTSAIYDTFNNAGTVEAGTGKLEFTRPFIQTAGVTTLGAGQLQADQGFTLNGGMFTGTNTLTGSVTNTAGLVSPGASPGRLAITGNYTEAANARLQIEIAGTTPGSGYDQLSVGGTATLAGTLDVLLLNGFTPAAGNVFTSLVCNARSGTFKTIAGPPGLFTVYMPKSVLLEPDNAPPVVQLTVNSVWLTCHTFTLSASATDPDDTVTNLTLLVGTNVIGAFPNGAPRVVTVSYDFPGDVTFAAQATDNRGAQGEADVNGTVTNLAVLVVDPIGFQTNRAFKLCMCGEAGTNYQVQFSTNAAATNWTALGAMESTNGIWRYLDAAATNSSRRFYRARQQ